MSLLEFLLHPPLRRYFIRPIILSKIAPVLQSLIFLSKPHGDGSIVHRGSEFWPGLLAALKDEMMEMKNETKTEKENNE